MRKQVKFIFSNQQNEYKVVLERKKLFCGILCCLLALIFLILWILNWNFHYSVQYLVKDKNTNLILDSAEVSIFYQKNSENFSRKQFTDKNGFTKFEMPKRKLYEIIFSKNSQDTLKILATAKRKCYTEGNVSESFSILKNKTQDIFLESRKKAKAILADFVFVVDVTGSMSGGIANLKNNILSFIENLEAEGVSYAIGIVVFGDGVYVYNSGNLYTKKDEILATINQLKVGERGQGGGDSPENQLGAIADASVMNFRKTSQKFLIMLTDAESHENDGITSWTVETLINNRLKANNISVYPVFNTKQEKQRKQYIPIAETTNKKGKYYDISDKFDEIIKDIVSKIECE